MDKLRNDRRIRTRDDLKFFFSIGSCILRIDESDVAGKTPRGISSRSYNVRLLVSEEEPKTGVLG